jgi:hypothetical protein
VYAFSAEIEADSHYTSEFMLLRAISLWRLGDTQRALEILIRSEVKAIQDSSQSSHQNSLTKKIEFYKYWILQSSGDENSWNLWLTHKDENLRSRSKIYNAAIEQEKRRPQKSPLVSGLMSAVLPGLGHVRLGLWQDAALTFALNALFIGATIDFSRTNQNFAAIAAGGVGSFFYVGGIISAAKLTENENNRETEKHLKESAFKIFPELKLEF